jgi:hypothetical protein
MKKMPSQQVQQREKEYPNNIYKVPVGPDISTGAGTEN